MKILLTGATGFVGMNILEALSTEGHDVTSFVRPDKDIPEGKIIVGDLRRADTIPSLSRFDAIVNACGMLGSPGITYQQLYDSNVLTVKNLLLRCRRQIFIHISSAGIYGPVRGADETYPMNPSNIYEKSKAESDLLVQRYPRNIILRPEFLYGPYDMHTLSIFRYVKEKRFHIIGDGKNLLQPTFIGDLADACKKSLNLKRDNVVMNIAGPKQITLNCFIDRIKKKLYAEYKTFQIPEVLARAYAKSRRFHRIGPDIQDSTIDFFTKTRTFDCSYAKETISVKGMPLDKGLDKTIRWYRKNGYL